MSARTVDRPRARGASPSRRARLTGRAAVLAVLLIVFGLAAIYPAKTYLAQRDRIAQLEGELARLEDAAARQDQRIEQLNDPAYLERIARECLGMVKPGEVPFVILPAGGEPAPLPC